MTKMESQGVTFRFISSSKKKKEENAILYDPKQQKDGQFLSENKSFFGFLLRVKKIFRS